MGSHTLRHFLVTTDWDVVATDSFRHKGKTDRIVVQTADLDCSSRLRVVTHDLAAPFSRQLIERIGPIDMVVSMASESHVDRSISDPVTFIRNNVDIVLNLLEYARVVKPKKFLHVSTDEVYGPAPAGHNHREWETHMPSNPYSASKAAQEDICFAYWRTYGVPVVITNTMNIIGELQDPEKFVPMVIRNCLEGRVTPIHAKEDTPGSRYYLHARNQADALRFILENIKPTLYDGYGDRPRKFHVVGEQEVDNLTMAKKVAEYTGYALRYELVDFHSSRPGHDLRYALDGSKLRNHGWRPPLSLWDSLAKTVEWTLKHPEWLLA